MNPELACFFLDQFITHFIFAGMTDNALELIDEVIPSIPDSKDFLDTRKKQIAMIGKTAPEIRRDQGLWIGAVALPPSGSPPPRIRLVCFWTPRADSCRVYFPFLEELKDKYGGGGLEILGVTSLYGFITRFQPGEEGNVKEVKEEADRKKEVNYLQEYCREAGMAFPTMIDQQKIMAKAFHVREEDLPHLLILDRDGILRFFWSRGGGEMEILVEGVIKNLLNDKD